MKLYDDKKLYDDITKEIQQCYRSMENDYNKGRNAGLFLAEAIIDHYFERMKDMNERLDNQIQYYKTVLKHLKDTESEWASLLFTKEDLEANIRLLDTLKEILENERNTDNDMK